MTPSSSRNRGVAERIHTSPDSVDDRALLEEQHIVNAEDDTIESLNPRAVIAAHKRPGNDDGPEIIEETRRYIRDFDRVAATTTTARELYDRMLELHPDRVNPGLALWNSACAVKP
jgi:hypothetical protein